MQTPETSSNTRSDTDATESRAPENSAVFLNGEDLEEGYMTPVQRRRQSILFDDVVKLQSENTSLKRRIDILRRRERFAAAVMIGHDCPICYRNLQNVAFISLTCGHVHCVACYRQLVQLKCPECRESF